MIEKDQQLEDLRKRIIERIEALNEELKAWQTCLKLIDKLLKRVEEKPPKIEKIIAEIRDDSGVILAKIYGDKNEVKIIPERRVQVDVNSKEFKQFFIRKVLENIRRENPKVQYKIKENRGILLEVSLKNISRERELRRIQGAVKWTFKKFLSA
ncbi:MAG TPA: hypothetical protein EYP16_03505 [Candidatus Atribacteria bacterium]|nr:hypothetical protein [Candidatus Atribacteria bacterium]